MIAHARSHSNISVPSDLRAASRCLPAPHRPVYFWRGTADNAPGSHRPSRPVTNSGLNPIAPPPGPNPNPTPHCTAPAPKSASSLSGDGASAISLTWLALVIALIGQRYGSKWCLGTSHSGEGPSWTDAGRCVFIMVIATPSPQPDSHEGAEGKGYGQAKMCEAEGLIYVIHSGGQVCTFDGTCWREGEYQLKFIGPTAAKQKGKVKEGWEIGLSMQCSTDDWESHAWVFWQCEVTG